jgi:hypothetical protein
LIISHPSPMPIMAAGIGLLRMVSAMEVPDSLTRPAAFCAMNPTRPMVDPRIDSRMLSRT